MILLYAYLASRQQNAPTRHQRNSHARPNQTHTRATNQTHMLAILASCSAFHLTASGVARSPLVRRSRSCLPVLAEQRSWWDKILYGQAGPPVPPPPPAPPVGDNLRAVFDQWDVNNNGKLELSEFRRAMLAVGLDSDAISAALEALGADDDGAVTYELLEARLPPGPRASVVARLNQDGVMDSLYVPPEKVCRPSLPRSLTRAQTKALILTRTDGDTDPEPGPETHARPGPGPDPSPNLCCP